MTTLPECVPRNASDPTFHFLDAYYYGCQLEMLQTYAELPTVRVNSFYDLIRPNDLLRQALCGYYDCQKYYEFYMLVADDYCSRRVSLMAFGENTELYNMTFYTREFGEEIVALCPLLELVLPATTASPTTIPPLTSEPEPATNETSSPPEPSSITPTLITTTPSRTSYTEAYTTKPPTTTTLMPTTTNDTDSDRATVDTPSPPPLNSSTIPPSSASSKSSFDTATIIGTTVTIAAVVALLAFIFISMKKKLRDSRKLGGSPSVFARHETPTSEIMLPSFLQTTQEPVSKIRQIPLDQLQLDKCISRGGFGEVFQGVLKGGQRVAVKRLLPALRKDQAKVDEFVAEIALTAMLVHPCIVTFIGVTSDSPANIGMITEFMNGGDLRQLLSEHQQTNQPTGFDVTKLKIALHVAQALTYLHGLTPAVVHRDLKSRNIMLSETMDAKLMDFGVSREAHSGRNGNATSYSTNRSNAMDGDTFNAATHREPHIASTMTAGVGSMMWMAPEVILGDRYDEKADVYSFGVVLSELDTHELPYAHAVTNSSGSRLPELVVLHLVLIGNVTAQFTAGADAAVVAIARECLQVDPARRPTAAQVAQRLEKQITSYQ